MAANRRSKGDGTIWRLPSGRWRAQYTYWPVIDGEQVRRYKTQTFRLKRDAQRWLADNTGKVPPDNRKFSEYAIGFWLDTVKDREVKEGRITKGTQYGYRKLLTKHINPRIGSVRLGKLTREHCRGVLDAMADDGLSSAYRSSVHTLMSSIITYAHNEGHIPLNVMANVRAPQPDEVADDGPDAVEAERIMDAARGDRWEALAELALLYGGRKTELTSLRWSDIDFEQGVWHIRDSKTRASRRTLPLLDSPKTKLKALRERQARERVALPYWAGEDYVFTCEDGTPLLGDGKSREVAPWWEALLTKADIPHKCGWCDKARDCRKIRRRFHASRHAAGTLLLDRGVRLEVVSAILGHADVKITARVYARVRADLIRREMERITGTPWSTAA